MSIEPRADVFPELFPRPVAAAAVALSARMFPLFPEEEQTITKAVEKRRIEFSAGRYCARHAMAQLGHVACAIPSGRDRVPVWPLGLVGSISHSTDYCAAVVAPGREYRAIGIDLESVDAVPAELVDQVLRHDEISALDLGARPDGADWLTLHFCLKEAAYKAFYPTVRQIISFGEMRIQLNVAARSYTAEILIDARRTVPVLQGRYLVRDARIYAACWWGH